MITKQNIWIINHYACDTFFDNGGRHYYIAKYLKRFEYNPTIFCSNSMHAKKGLYFDFKGLFQIRKQEKIDVDYVFIKTREYEGNSKERVLNMLDFYHNILKTAKVFAKNFGKPDLIYASSVHPLSLVAGIKIAKRFGIKCISEIRDLWPESLIAYKMTKPNSSLTKILRFIEKWCYIKSDKIIFTMENAYLYIKEQGWQKKIPLSKIAYINNGVDLDDFNNNKSHFIFEDQDLNDKHAFKVVYTGSIRKVNNLGLLLDAAKLINNPAIKILIWGYGNELEVLKKRVHDENIGNVVFKGIVKKEYIPYITSKADLNLLHNTESKISMYGLSLNKMFEYAAAEKPILIDFGTFCNPLLDYGAAIATKDNTAESIAEGIIRASKASEEERFELCSGAKECSRAYDFKILTKKIIEIIEDL